METLFALKTAAQQILMIELATFSIMVAVDAIWGKHSKTAYRILEITIVSTINLWLIIKLAIDSLK